MSETDQADAGRLAPYASLASRSRGRLHHEAESASRGAFQRDRDRIVHSMAFRRLKHKTQVFLYDEGDHYRTRLTHSLEVAQIARSIARALRLDEDLAEALALAHDLGHPPFGHAGEQALNAAMAPYGGFDHNAQSLRIVTRLENRYAEFDGLNLTWETLEGLAKHNGPLITDGGPELSWAIRDHQAHQDLELATHPSLEAQVAAIADDIAYDSHDIDDGLRAGLFDLEELAGVALTAPHLADVDRRYPGLAPARRVHETMRRLITGLVEDVMAETRANIAAANPCDVAAVRAAGRMLCAFSAPLARAEAELKAFLKARVYRSEPVGRTMAAAGAALARLFERYLEDAEALPESWRQRVASGDETARARRICDLVSGMTDRFALSEHQRLFDATPDLG